VGAIVAVNCFGDIVDPSTGRIIAGALNPGKDGFADSLEVLAGRAATGVNVIGSNPTIGCVATNARLTKSQVTKVAQMTHDGFARTINPIHTMYDGDTVFALATGQVEADLTAVGSLAAQVMAQAVLNGIRAAETLFGIPGYGDIQKKLRGQS